MTSEDDPFDAEATDELVGLRAMKNLMGEAQVITGSIARRSPTIWRLKTRHPPGTRGACVTGAGGMDASSQRA